MVNFPALEFVTGLDIHGNWENSILVFHPVGKSYYRCGRSLPMTEIKVPEAVSHPRGMVHITGTFEN